MKAVMYGGGNIGRGFIGLLLSEAGYRVTFIDVAEAVVNTLKEKEEYPVRYVSSEGFRDVTVKNVTAVNGGDEEAAAAAIAECDLMATAVGARILKFIAKNIAMGLRRRFATTDKPLNIIICENLMNADKILAELVKGYLTEEERALFDERVGLVEASIGRMVPVQTEEMKDGDPLRVCVESYRFLPVDRDAFKGEIPEVDGMVPSSPFSYYIKRKLYIHNAGHATCAYLGGLFGYDYIYEAIDDPEIRIITECAMLENGMALSSAYGMEMQPLRLHIQELLGRFTNAALMDTCARVGGDPARKLSPDDRMIGSARMAIESGVLPTYITLGAAAAVLRYLNESEDESLKAMDRMAAAERVLTKVSGLGTEGNDATLRRLILDYVALILSGADKKTLRRAADANKTASLLGKIV